MARNKATLQNIDLSNPSDYLNGRIKDNTGSGDGTPVNERVYGDFHQLVAKLMNLSGLAFNNLPENETNGYQFIDSLRNLAGKNDLNYELSKSGSVLTLPIRLGKVTNNEIFRAKVTFNKGSETTIRGTLDNANKSVTYLGDFKQNEYVRLINTSASVLIIREVDDFNLGTIVEELLYLKASTQMQEDAGELNTVATTPIRNKTVFTKRVNGDDSGDYLANTNRNGLLSAAFWDIINGIGTPALRNRNNFILGDIAGVSAGNSLVSNYETDPLVTQAGSGRSTIDITFDNAMDNMNYRLDFNAESLGNIDSDNDFRGLVFKKISTTKASFLIQESANVTQNIKIHVDVIQL